MRTDPPLESEPPRKAMTALQKGLLLLVALGAAALFWGAIYWASEPVMRFVAGAFK